MATIPGSQRLLNLTGTTVATTATVQAGTLLIGSGVTAGGKVTSVTAGTANTDAVNLQQLNNATTGVLVYIGTWNANTNTPSLSSGVGTVGQYYIVSVDGTTLLDGINDWKVGDWAVFSDQATDAWQKIDNTSILGGAGTGGNLAAWSGSGTTLTLENAPATFNGNNVTFAGNVIVTGNLNPSGSMRIAGGSDQGSQLCLFADSNGHTSLAGFDFEINTGSNNSRSRSFFINSSGATFTGALSVTGVSNLTAPVVISTNDSTLTIKDAGTNATQIVASAGDELYIGSNNTYQIQMTPQGNVNAESNWTFSNNATFAGAITLIDGSAPTPSINFTGDSNTGIYQPANNLMGFVSNGSRKLLVDTAGVTVQNGNLFINSDSSSASNNRIMMGVGSDLQIYHDGSNSYIDDVGTGSLYNRTTLFIVQNTSSTKNSIIGNPVADVKLYYNGVKKFETTNTGVTVNGKGISSATVAGDGSTTLTTKGYVDTAVAGTQDLNKTGIWFQTPGKANTNSPRNDGYYSNKTIKYTTFQANFTNLSLLSGSTYYLVISRFKKGQGDNYDRTSQRASGYKIMTNVNNMDQPYRARPLKIQITSSSQNFDFRPDLYFSAGVRGFPRPSGYNAPAGNRVTSKQNFAFRIEKVTSGTTVLSDVLARLQLQGDKSNSSTNLIASWKPYQ